jgi:hypothetical protein
MRNKSGINATTLYFSPVGLTISNIGGGSRGFQWLVRIYRLAELKQMKDS